MGWRSKLQFERSFKGLYTIPAEEVLSSETIFHFLKKKKKYKLLTTNAHLVIARPHALRNLVSRLRDYFEVGEEN